MSAEFHSVMDVRIVENSKGCENFQVLSDRTPFLSPDIQCFDIEIFISLTYSSDCHDKKRNYRSLRQMLGVNRRMTPRR